VSPAAGSRASEGRELNLAAATRRARRRLAIEILQAAGVSRSTWWGRALLTVLQYVRLPFTAIGFRYDLNHHQWIGPDAGNKFDPGSTLGP